MNLPTSVTRLLNVLQLEYKETVAARRGSLVLTVMQSGQRCVLKIHMEDGDPLSVGKAELLQHEATILAQIPHLTRQLYRAHGTTDGMYWLLTRQVQGPEARLAVREILHDHNTNDARKHLLGILTMITEFYDRLYTSGYLHGDVQPAHTLLEGNAVTVIDWGLARPVDKQHPLYRGGFVYYVAPEVAKDMQTKANPVKYGAQAEVYALGTTLFTIVTGELAIDFGVPKQELRATPMPLKLERVISNHIRSFSDVGSLSIPELEDVLMRAMATDPASRFAHPSEFHRHLQSLL